MSELFIDTDVEYVSIALNAKDGSGTATFLLGKDYFASGELYTTNDPIYPILAESPRAQRGVGIYAGIKFDTQLSLYGKSDLYRKGFSFCDLLEDYDIHDAEVKIWYVTKARDALATYSADTAVRQTLRAVDSYYNEATGILTVTCKDTWFKDKEVSKKLDPSMFPDLDPRWDGEYGAVIFGQSSVAGNGIVIDAPVTFKQYEFITGASFDLFAGWAYGTHQPKAVDRIIVQNQHKTKNNEDWITLSSTNTPYGESVSSPVADPANWGRDLSRFQRGIIYTPTEGQVLTAVTARLEANDLSRCADIIDGQYFFNASNWAMLTAGDRDFTIEMVLKFDALHTTANRIIARCGDTTTGTLEWMIYFDTVDDKITFGISTDGSTIAKTVKWGTAASTGTWYHVVCQHDAGAGDAIGIYVNAGTVVTTARGADFPTDRNGSFSIGVNLAGETGFDGKLQIFRYWRRLITGSEVTALYNSGNWKLTADMSDTEKERLQCSYDFQEPYGTRKDSYGRADLTPGSVSSSVATDISYDYSTKAITPSNAKGEMAVEIYHATTRDSGDTYTVIGTPLRRMAIDNAYTPLAGGNDSIIIVDPPLTIAPDVTYLVALTYTNEDTDTYFVRCWYDGNSGSTHYARDIRRNDQAWVKQTDVRLFLKLNFASTLNTFTVDNEDGINDYAKKNVTHHAVSIYDTSYQIDPTTQMIYKLGMQGLKDDGSGTYTGSASAIIENPAAIIHFTLMNSDFGLGLSSTYVDTSSLTTAKTAMSTFGLSHKIAITEETTAEDLILEICRQARMIVYKTRAGKIALKVPSAISSIDIDLSEVKERGDLALIDVRDNDYSSIVNSFKQYYSPDMLNLPSDPALIRRAEREKLAGKLELNASYSSASDTGRVDICAASEARYGKREMTFPLDFFDSASYAIKIQNYYCDRYSTLQRRVEFRIPRRRYYSSLGLFSNIKISHTGIETSNGTTLLAKQFYDYDVIKAYDNGVPSVVWQGGVIKAQVLEIEEEGPWMRIVAETVSEFS